MKNKISVSKKGQSLCLASIFLFIFTFSMAFSCQAADFYNKKGDGLKSHIATSIHATEDFVWFSSSVAGAISFDKQSEEFRLYTRNKDKLLGAVYSVVTAFDKTWIGTNLGMNVIDEDGVVTSVTEIEVPSIENPGEMTKKGIREARNLWFEGGYLWLCSYTVHGGLFKFDGKYWEEMKFGMSKFNYVTDIEVVGDDIWFGTSGYGVYIFNDISRRWTILNSASEELEKLVHDSVNDISFVKGKVWVCTAGGVSVIDPQKNGKFGIDSYTSKNTAPEMSLDNPTAMTTTKEGVIYVGTTNGLSKFSDGTWERMELTDEDGNAVPFTMVKTLAIDGDYLWVGSNKGIFREQME